MLGKMFKINNICKLKNNIHAISIILIIIVFNCFLLRSVMNTSFFIKIYFEVVNI